MNLDPVDVFDETIGAWTLRVVNVTTAGIHAELLQIAGSIAQPIPC